MQPSQKSIARGMDWKEGRRRVIRLLPDRLASQWHVLSALLAMASAAWAHGPWHEQLAAVESAIQADPGDGSLYLKRAHLRSDHGDWELARKDVAAAGDAGSAPSHCAYARTRIAVAEGKWTEAKAEIPKFQEAYAMDAEAWRLRAVVHEQLGELAAQLEARRTALSRANPPGPEDYLLLARPLAAAGKLDAARETLDEGLQKLGLVPAILDAAIALDAQAKAWDSALRRIDEATARYPNPARWLARKGEIAQEAGRAELAREARKAAVAVLEAMPEGRRNVPANAALLTQLRAQLSSP